MTTAHPLRSACCLFAAFVPLLCAGQTEPAAGRPRFRKHVLDADLPALSVAVLDVDGDGRLDVAAAGGPHGGHSPYSGKVFWYRAPDWHKAAVADLGERSIVLHIDAAQLSHPLSTSDPHTAADLVVSDGHLEEAIRFRFDRKLQTWTGTRVADAVSKVHGSDSGDIDGDGFADLVMAHRGPRGQPSRLEWFRNPGQHAPNPAQVWARFRIDLDDQAIAGGPHYVRLIDLNGNNRLDLLLGSSHAEGWFGIWFQGEDPRQPWRFRRLDGPMVRGTNLDAADLSGDGHPDLVATEGHGTGLWWFPAPDYPPIRLDEDLQHTHCLAIADIDGDGRPDLVTGGYRCGRFAVFYNLGDGRFQREIIDTNQASYDVRVADLNGNGRLDLVVAGQRSGNVVWYENLGDTPP